MRNIFQSLFILILVGSVSYCMWYPKTWERKFRSRLGLYRLELDSGLLKDQDQKEETSLYFLTKEHPKRKLYLPKLSAEKMDQLLDDEFQKGDSIAVWIDKNISKDIEELRIYGLKQKPGKNFYLDVNTVLWTKRNQKEKWTRPLFVPLVILVFYYLKLIFSNPENN